MRLLAPGLRRFSMAVGFAALAAGCSASGGQPLNAGSDVDLSSALAFRQGDPMVTIVGPADGAAVVSPVTLSVETKNLTLSPAGETQDGEGHIHVLVDQDCLQPGLVIPSETHTIHLGDGSGHTSLALEPGRHQVCVQVGDGFHIAVAVVDRISVNVVDKNALQSSEVTEPVYRSHPSP